MNPCEDCGDEVARRVRCYHCGLFVCPWCWHHIHCCQPSHTRAECRDYAEYRRLGPALLDKRRANKLHLYSYDDED